MISPELLACPSWCDYAGEHGWEYVNAMTGEAARSHEHKLDEPSDPFGVYIGAEDRLGVDGVHRSEALLYVSAPEFGRGFTPAEAKRFQELLTRAVGLLEQLEEEEPSARCHCGRPVQDAAVAGHRCRQCAEHCEIARYEREAAVAGIVPAYADTDGRPSVH